MSDGIGRKIMKGNLKRGRSVRKRKKEERLREN
jgi:hypothetical protein